MKTEPEREPYEKPELRVIELSADEVLAVGCKAPGLNPASDIPASCGVGAGCSALGS